MFDGDHGPLDRCVCKLKLCEVLALPRVGNDWTSNAPGCHWSCSECCPLICLLSISHCLKMCLA
jgi:hypothetical protein